MKSEPLMDVTIDTVLFFALSGAEVVNEDTAVAMLEQITDTLRQLSASDLARFLNYLRHRTAQAAPGREREAMEHLAADIGPLGE